MMGRYGSTEMNAMTSRLLFHLKLYDDTNLALKMLSTYSGFFQHSLLANPIDDLEKFSSLMIEATKNADVIGTWNGHLGFEEYFIDKFTPSNLILTDLLIFGPNIHSNIPWTYALKDKVVLVIHPFAQTIENQYTIREKLFENPKVLPSFHLKTFKAIQTMNEEKDERFKNWFEALDWMSEEISKIDFDIALLGCGAYGFPLASRIKNMGKIAIHCGGALQLLFGIKGKRWEIEQPQIGQMLFNPYWVRPNTEETIQNNEKIENGCYW